MVEVREGQRRMLTSPPMTKLAGTKCRNALTSRVETKSNREEEKGAVTARSLDYGWPERSQRCIATVTERPPRSVIRSCGEAFGDEGFRKKREGNETVPLLVCPYF